IVERTHERAPVIETGLDRVRAAIPDDRVDNLVRLADTAARSIRRSAEALESADHDRRQTALRSGVEADARRIECGVERRKHLRVAIEAEAEFIEELARNDLRCVQSR